MKTETTANQNVLTFERCSSGDLLAMLKDVIARRVKLSAEDYIELVKALNKRAA